MIVLLAILAVLAGASTLLYYIIGHQRYGKGIPAGLPQLGANEGALRDKALRPEPCRTVRVYFIKPSRYDEEGYVQFYRWGVLPMNTLTVLAALNESFNKRYSIERNVYLETVIWDELCDGPITPETIRAIKEKGREDG